MVNLPSLDSQARIVSDAAQNFVEHYYSSLNKRLSLAQYYASTSPHLASAAVKPDISINGRVLKSPEEYEKMLDEQGKPVYYEVRSFDTHPVSPNYSLGCPEALSLPPDELAPGWAKISKSIKDGDRVSFMIQVSGLIKYGKPNEGPADASAAVTAATGEKKEESATESQLVEKVFDEAWILVPHWEALGRNAARGLRPWVVVSQNFRSF
ncbi:nuclear transport factor 2 domain-containing protein [Xylaria nigripes]|nr:nuclear transport factor 2 domain-containing protein [Xylaria nigripes]